MVHRVTGEVPLYASARRCKKAAILLLATTEFGQERLWQRVMLARIDFDQD